MSESWEYIASARMQVVADMYNKAFDLFLVAFERDPNLIHSHEVEFRSVMLRLNSILSESDKIDIIFDNFARALKTFPQSVHINNDIGSYFYKYGYYREAWDRFEKALTLSPTNVVAAKSLNSVKNLMVERWHFRMLNDNLRNESYRQAIHQLLTQEDKVLDVGTGTGLLAIYAYEKGPSKIIGCDGSECMSHLADTIVRGNKIHKIKIVNKMSTELTLWDLGGKCSVLLTEMFDAALFGEHVLQMLRHAWPALLIDKATVLPNTAEFFVVGVQCDHLSKNYHLGSEAKSFLNISALNVHVYADGDTYDCEDVHLIKDLKYLTEPQSVLKINFNDLDEIKETLKRTEPYQIRLKAKENGLMNIVIGWFNLYLSDTITITTNPTAPDRANAWQQAVFYDNIPKIVKETETVNLGVLMNGGKLTLVPTPDNPITRASMEIIRFLNDNEYIKLITNCVSIGSVYLGQIAEMSQTTIADLCPFPLFGLLMLKRGAKSLLCRATNELDKEFIVKVFSENKVSMSNVTIVFGDDWTPEIFGQELYHAIFTHSLDLSGDVEVRLHQIAEHLKSMHLHPGGLFMPAQMKIIAQLVSSHWLDLNNRLFDYNVSNYAMAKRVNKFRVTQNFSLDFSILKYVPMSEPIILCNYPDGLANESKPVKIVSDGHANAILCWYIIELMDHTQEISTNRPNSFIQGMLFLTYSKKQLIAGEEVKITQYKDVDGGFMLNVGPV